MKKKALISSILTIALCLSLVAGSTFALFTASTDFNIAVTAGKVDIEASASISAVYSAEGVGDGETAEDRFLIDENDNEYKHVASLDKKTFANGGVAELDGASLKIQRLTPGDKVDIQINVANNSNVAISYRYKIAINPNSTLDNELATGMVVSVLDKLTFAKESYEGFESYTSEWYYVEAPDGNPVAIEPRTISVELPVYAGNEYQEKSVEYIVTVEAVQGNAVTTNDSIVTILPEAFQKMMDEREEITANGGTVELVDSLFLTDKVTVIDALIKGENADAGAGFTAAAILWNGDLTLGDGATVNAGDYGLFVMDGGKITLDAGSKIVVNDDTLDAICVQGSAFSEFELHLGATGLIVDEEGNVADAKITLLNAGSSTFRIYVPSLEAYNEYLPMLDTDSQTPNVTWYVGGIPVSGDTVKKPAGNFTVEGNSDTVIVGNGEDTVIDINGNIQNAYIANATITGENSLNVGAGDTILFENVVFDGNFGIVAQGVVNGNATFKNCTFKAGFHIDNSADTANVTFIGCTFSENSYIKLGGYADYRMENCTVEALDANAAGPWGKQWIIAYDDITFVNCELGRLVRAGGDIVITFENCVDANGVAVTEDAVHTYNNPTIVIR